MTDWAKIAGWSTTLGLCAVGAWKITRTGGMSILLKPKQAVIKAAVGCAVGIALEALPEDADPSCYNSEEEANYARDAAAAAKKLQQQILKTLPTGSSAICKSVWPVYNRALSIKEFNRRESYLARCQESKPGSSISTVYLFDAVTQSHEIVANGNAAQSYSDVPLMEKAANGQCTPAATR